MQPFSLNQAASKCKRSKATLLDVLNSGRLSGSKDGQNRWQIDPAELFRVYPVTSPEPATETEADPAPERVETALLERIISTLEDERDHLRRRLDAETEERREAQAKLTALLTYQPTAPEASSPEPVPGERYAAAWWLAPWTSATK